MQQENEERGLAVVPQTGTAIATSHAAGTLALAMMSDQEFEARLAALKKGQERQARVQRELMTENVDYGCIPGTGDKPTLLKPGAEKLCNLYGLIPEFKDDRTYGDGKVAPAIRVFVTCYLHAGAEGPVVGMGVGECNSWEKKYRWREGQRTCPECGLVGGIISGKEEYGGGWLCWKRKGGCGAKFAKEDPRITEQQVGQVENSDPFDLCNTIVKMAAKRAYIDAALRTTATSGLFTQDVEDLAETPAATPSAPHTPPQAQPPQTPPARPAPRPAAPRRPASDQIPPEEGGPNGPETDEYTAFFKAGLGLGYKDVKALFAALNVKSMADWVNQGRTLTQALDELAQLQGKKPAA